MDGNNWRPAAEEESNGTDGNDWRNQLPPDARQKIVNKIMETLKKHLPVSGPEGLVELQKIAVRFEEKIFTAALSQSDYLRKMSMKMLTMENKSQPAPTNTLPPNANPNPSDQASMDSTAQTGHTGVGDWQEEVYQKIKSMKEPVRPPQQGQQPPPVGQSHAMVQQSQPQITQLQQHDKHLNQTKSMNFQPSMPSMQAPAATGMPHVSVPLTAHLGIPTTQHGIMNALQPSSNLDSMAGNTMSSMIGSLQHNTIGLWQNTFNTAQQANINTLSQSGSSALQPNLNHIQQSSTMLHHPHLKQVQLMQTQLKQQFQQQQLIQQQQQKQQHLQQQQQKLPQSLQLQQHHMPQLHQMNEANELKVKSMSPNALSSSVGDIGSVVTMVDRIAGLPSGLPPALSSVSGLNQNAVSNVVSQGSNLQTMPGISQNCMTSSVGQGVQSHMFANIQRQMPGKPQQVVPQQHQQQSQNSLQLICEQLQHQLSKQKMQQGDIQPNILPLHMLQQQPSLLQPNHMHYLLLYLFLIIFLIYYLYCF